MIKNYTSTVPAGKSILHIEHCLSSHGAQSIIKKYEDKHLVAVSFFMQLGGKLIPFMLPAKVKQVEKILRENIIRPQKGTLDKLVEQAERTAWKIISDWIDAQMALVELNQAEMAEIFFPYMWQEKTGQTLYQIQAERGFSLLEAPKK